MLVAFRRFPGYVLVSIRQCMRVDRELFMLLAREVAPPFKVDSAGKSPLDAQVERLMYDPRVQHCLLPLQKGASSSVLDTSGNKPGKPSRPSPKARIRLLHLAVHTRAFE